MDVLRDILLAFIFIMVTWLHLILGPERDVGHAGPRLHTLLPEDSVGLDPLCLPVCGPPLPAVPALLSAS